jgi:hypothetical protein
MVCFFLVFFCFFWFFLYINFSYILNNLDNQEQVIKQICITYNEFALHLMNEKNYKEALRFIDEALKFKQDDYILHLNR